jgi:hypothetical protein
MDCCAARALPTVVQRGRRASTWCGTGIELRGVRADLGKARALGRRAASGGAVLARTPRQRGRAGTSGTARRRGTEHGAVPVGSICFVVPLFDHEKLQNFE